VAPQNVNSNFHGKALARLSVDTLDLAASTQKKALDAAFLEDDDSKVDCLRCMEASV
jgi:hypothetical protein